MSNSPLKVLDTRPEYSSHTMQVFDSSMYPQGHLLKDIYIIDSISLSKIDPAPKDRYYRTGYSQEFSVLVEVQFSSVLPFGTVMFEIESKNVSRAFSTLLTTIFPLYVQSQFEKMTSGDFAKYLPYVMHLPYMDIKEYFGNEDALYLNYGVHHSIYCYVDFKYGHVSFSELFREGIYHNFEESCEKIATNIDQIMPLLTNKEIAYGTRYGKWVYQKLALVRDTQGNWKKTNASNTKIKELIGGSAAFSALSHTSIGTKVVTPGAMLLTIEEVINKNSKCDLIQRDIYIQTEHKEKKCKTYEYSETQLLVEYLQDGQPIKNHYMGKYQKLINKPIGYTNTVVDIIHFEEVELIHQKDTFTTNYPEQIEVRILANVLVDDTILYVIKLYNNQTELESSPQNIVAIGNMVFRLTDDDTLVQRSGKYLKLAEKLAT